MNVGGPELIFLVVVLLLVGIAPYVTWRRGGSRSRILAAFLASIPYTGWIAAMIIALTTRRPGGLSGGGAVVAQVGRSAVEHAPAPDATVVKRPSKLWRAALIVLPVALALYMVGPDLRIDTQLGPEYGCVSGSMTRAPSEATPRGDPGACSTGGSPVIIGPPNRRSTGLYLNHPEWRVFDVGVAGVRGFGATWYGR
jgi:hypothetical protein